MSADRIPPCADPMSPMSTRYRWISACEEDIPTVYHISTVVHPAFPEAIDVFENRLAVYPAGFYILVDTETFPTTSPTAAESSRAMAAAALSVTPSSPLPDSYWSSKADSFLNATEEKEKKAGGEEGNKEAINASIVGYAVFHPWEARSAPPLDFIFADESEVLPDPSQTPDPKEAADDTWLYWHDCAILPTVRNSGGGKAIVSIILSHAAEERYKHVALTSVNNSTGYWSSRGFAAAPRAMLPKPMKKMLDDHYGDDATFMVYDV